MRRFSFPITAAILIFAASCAPSGEKINPNLKCSATISAASHLSSRGLIETSASFDKQALFSIMMHLNTFAIPNGVREPDAMALLKAHREALLADTSPSKIYKEAEACIRKMPGG